MSWLSDYELSEKIQRNGSLDMRSAFYGIYPIDKLPRVIPRFPIFFIVNTHPHNLDGEHWKIIFINENRIGEVFDSLSQPMSDLLIRWMNRFCLRWRRNRKRYQHLLSSTCGAFCLYFIFNRFHLRSFDRVIATFSRSPSANERKVLKFYNRLE